MTELLEGLNCMVWVGNVIFWWHSGGMSRTTYCNLLRILELVLERLERLESVGLFAAAHE